VPVYSYAASNPVNRVDRNGLYDTGVGDVLAYNQMTPEQQASLDRAQIIVGTSHGAVLGGGYALSSLLLRYWYLLPAAAPAAQAGSEQCTRLYHKGNLVNGLVGNHRWLSTGVDWANVNALDRAGRVFQFNVPTQKLNEWLLHGHVQTLRDYDKITGVYNLEYRFSPALAKLMNEYMQKN
jgi:hypothetical protein